MAIAPRTATTMTRSDLSPNTKRTAPARLLRAVMVLAFLAVVAAPPAPAQQLAPGRTVPGRGPLAEEENLPTATEYDPERVRNHLRAIHGFTRARLEAASTDVPRILMGWIADPTEPMLIRRQAIKALKFYASGETFAFIRAELPQAPTPLQMLFLGTLQAHTGIRPAEVAEVAKPYLDSGAVVVRHAAVSLIGRLGDTEGRRQMLRKRLATEPDPGVRRAIQKVLQE
jgi:hypothetical protein